MMEGHLDVGLPFPVNVLALPMSTLLGEITSEHDHQAGVFNSV